MFRYPESFGKYLRRCATAVAVFLPLAGAYAQAPVPMHPNRSASDNAVSGASEMGLVEVAQQTSAHPVLSQRHFNKRKHPRIWRRHHGEAGFLRSGDDPALADASNMVAPLYA